MPHWNVKKIYLFLKKRRALHNILQVVEKMKLINNYEWGRAGYEELLRHSFVLSLQEPNSIIVLLFLETNNSV